MIGQLKIYLSVHVGFSISQLAIDYLASGIAYHGGTLGFLRWTPLQSYVSLEPAGNAGQTFSLLDFMAVFDFIKNTVDVVKVLLWFDYDLLDAFDASHGLSYWMVLLVRLGSWVGTYELGLKVAKLLFSSGLLQSATGILLVLGGAAATLL